MASTNFTTHYSIPLPLGTDLTTPMDYNEAAEEIDTALFGAVTDALNASEAAGEAVNTANTASATAESVGDDLAIEKAKIVQLQTRMTAAENDIDDVYTDVTDMVTSNKEPSATSTHNYAIGNYFIYNETLYKATAAISIGDTIVPNTNCETTNTCYELYKLGYEGKVVIEATQNETWSQFMKRAFLLLRDVAIDKRVRSTLVYYNTSTGNSNLYRISGINPSNSLEFGNVIHAGSTTSVYYNHSDESVIGYTAIILDGVSPTLTAEVMTNNACADATHRCFVVIG